MARIDLDLAHSYKADPRHDADYALLPLKMAFEDGGAYALLGPSGCGKTTHAERRCRACCSPRRGTGAGSTDGM
jgi:ABC-type dipeptide/oligopeptide/nickel transport system ATPase subunit